MHSVNKLNSTARALWNDQSGATAIEYGLIASLVCVVVIASYKQVGTNLSATWNNVSTNMK